MQSATGHRRITTSEHVSEAAGILAAGILRIRRRQAGDTHPLSERRLDTSADSSVHSRKPGAGGEKL